MSRMVENGSLTIFDLETHNSQETQAFGAELARHLTAGDVLCFYGELGAGKTTCIQGICRALGVTQAITSPTFTLINEYQGDWPVYHFDFYRIADESETADLGLSEYFYGDGVCLLEWPERIPSLLPAKRWEIRMFWDLAAADFRKIKVTVQP